MLRTKIWEDCPEHFLHITKSGVLKPERLPESPGGFVKTDCQRGTWLEDYLHV